MSKKGEISLTPEELEYAFAQAARFGGFLLFLYNNKEAGDKVFKKNNLSTDDGPSLDWQNNSKKTAMMELVHMFEDQEQNHHGRELMEQLSDLYKSKTVWDHIETFGYLCKISRDHHRKS